MASEILGGGVQAHTDALQKGLLCFPTHEPGKQTQTEPILMSVWLSSLQFSLHVCVQTKYLGQKEHTWFAAEMVVRGGKAPGR